jgi:N12 class adenine-specific DNA methylase
VAYEDDMAFLDSLEGAEPSGPPARGLRSEVPEPEQRGGLGLSSGQVKKGLWFLDQLETEETKTPEESGVPVLRSAKRTGRIGLGEQFRRSMGGELYGQKGNYLQGAVAHMSPVARLKRRKELAEVNRRLTPTAGKLTEEDEVAAYREQFKDMDDNDLHLFAYGTPFRRSKKLGEKGEVVEDSGPMDRELAIRHALTKDKDRLEELTAFERELEERGAPLPDYAPLKVKAADIVRRGVMGAVDMVPYMMKMAVGPAGAVAEGMVQFDERTAGQGEIDDQGRYTITKDQSSALEAAWKSAFSAAAEYYIEKGLGKHLGILGKTKAGQAVLNSRLGTAVRKLGQRVAGKKFGPAMQKLSDVTGLKIFSGLNPKNLVEEIILEEGVQAVWDAAWNLDDMQVRDPETGELRDADFAERQAMAISGFARAVPEMVVSFGLFGIGGGAADISMTRQANAAALREAQEKELDRLGVDPEIQKAIIGEKDERKRAELLTRAVLSQQQDAVAREAISSQYQQQLRAETEELLRQETEAAAQEKQEDATKGRAATATRDALRKMTEETTDAQKVRSDQEQGPREEAAPAEEAVVEAPSAELEAEGGQDLQQPAEAGAEAGDQEEQVEEAGEIDFEFLMHARKLAAGGLDAADKEKQADTRSRAERLTELADTAPHSPELDAILDAPNRREILTELIREGAKGGIAENRLSGPLGFMLARRQDVLGEFRAIAAHFVKAASDVQEEGVARGKAGDKDAYYKMADEGQLLGTFAQTAREVAEVAEKIVDPDPKAFDQYVDAALDGSLDIDYDSTIRFIKAVAEKFNVYVQTDGESRRGRPEAEEAAVGAEGGQTQARGPPTEEPAAKPAVAPAKPEKPTEKQAPKPAAPKPAPAEKKPKRTDPQIAKEAERRVEGPQVIQAPSGKWGFVGRVPQDVAFVQDDGSDITQDQAKRIKIAGPGFVKGIKERLFDTEQAARDFLEGRQAPKAEKPLPEAPKSEKIEPGKKEAPDDTEPSVAGKDEGALAKAQAEDVRRLEEIRSTGRSPEGDSGDGGQPVDTTGVPGAGLRAGLGSGQRTSLPAGRGDGPESRGPRKRTSTDRGRNFRIAPDADLGAGSPKAKYKKNLAAIRLIHQLEAEDRPATPDEQATIAQYAGWGAIPQVFDRDFDAAYRSHQEQQRGETLGRWEKSTLDRASEKEWWDRHVELRGLLSEDEYEAARSSTVNAHFTSPEVIAGMYNALGRLGFQGGRMLETSAGTGHMIGMQPELARPTSWTAVELDPLTSKLLAALYPEANVRRGGFESARLANDFFDVAMSNVPFGDYRLHDPKFNKYRFPIHDYFFAKTLDKIRPGGVMAFVTSRYTLDKKDKKMLRYLSEHGGEILGAIRLPRTAFKDFAGTEVVTDIIFIRKTTEGTADNSRFMQTVAREIDGQQVTLNQYFVENPGMVLGTLDAKGTMYRSAELSVAPAETDASLTDQITAAARALPENAFLERPKETRAEAARAEPMPAPDSVKEGNLVVAPDGKVYVSKDGNLVPEEVKGGKQGVARLQAMLEIRGAVRAVLKSQVDNEDDAQLAKRQKALTKAYDAFVKKYGPLHDRRNVAAIRMDVDAPVVLAVENWDADKKKATKSDIFTKRVIAHPERPSSADTPQDAMRITLNEAGRLEWDRISQLTGQSVAEVQAALLQSRDVFRNPETEKLESRDEYLSGYVKDKLTAARSAAEHDSSFAPNVEALAAVQPADIPMQDISPHLGSPWIPAAAYNAFLAHLTNRDGWEVVHNNITGGWGIAHARGGTEWDRIRQSRGNATDWGTPEFYGHQLVEKAMNGKTPRVWVKDGDSRRLDRKATNLAQQKVEAIKQEFANWVWSEKKRADALVRVYNDTFNNSVPREWDGSSLTLPGMSPLWQTYLSSPGREYQRAVIARGVQGGNLLLNHVVGAGKTIEMIGIGMELRRLGFSKKPLYVVPNHKVDDWASDFRAAYPAANILIGYKEMMAGSKRREFLSRIATGNWDAVIIAHSTYERIGMSPAAQANYARQEIKEIEDAILAARAQESEQEAPRWGGRQAKKKGSRIVKDLEKKKDRLKTRIQQLSAQEKKDTMLSFEELGVDYLFIDEAHNFKGLPIYSSRERVAGLQQSASQRAVDMEMKCRYINGLHGGKRGVCFATGTPISNSISEVYVMLRFLAPDVLRHHGIKAFDDWANTFGEVVNAIEVTPTGEGYRVHPRFARFQNVGELMRLMLAFTDVKLRRHLQIKTPPLLGGKPQMHSAAPTPWLKSYIAELVDRAEQVKTGTVDPHDDNMLKITNDGRKAALDERLIDPDRPDNPNSKVNQCVKNVRAIWAKTKKDKGAQLVFCDLGIPKGSSSAADVAEAGGAAAGTFDVYTDMKRKLVKSGIPAKQIAFIHDAGTDAKKAALFSKVRLGEVRILIGNTPRMGEGTNVQHRLYALHHLDVPWKPAHLEQRNGRIMRPGNMYTDSGVEVHNYATKESFDAYMWQTVERKAQFIESLWTADMTTREVDDVDSTALTAAEMKAIASGNPLVAEKIGVEKDIERLQLKKDAAEAEAQHRRWGEQERVAKIKHLEAKVAGLEQDIPDFKANKPKKFELVYLNKPITGADAIQGRLAEADADLRTSGHMHMQLGRYAGFEVEIRIPARALTLRQLVVRHTGWTWGGREFVPESLHYLRTGKGETTEYVNVGNAVGAHMNQLGPELARTKKALEIAKRDQAQAASQGVTFDEQEELDRLYARLGEINAELGIGQDDSATDQLSDDDEPPQRRRTPSGNAFPAGATTLPPPAPAAGTPDFKLFEEMGRLAKKYAGRVGEGYTPPGSAGMFYRDTKNVFARALNDMFVVIHETAHAAEDQTQFRERILRVVGTTSDGKPKYDPDTQKERTALTKVYMDHYPTAKKSHRLEKRVVEGLATFLQKYVEHPAEMELEHPDLVTMFLTPGGKYHHRILTDVVRDARAIVDRYRKLDGMQRILARVTKETQRALGDRRLLGARDRYVEHMEDELYPAEAVAKLTGVHFTRDDPSLWMRMYKQVGRMFAHNVSAVRVGTRKTQSYMAMDADGNWREELDYNWATLIERLHERGDSELFSGWLVARRAYFNFDRLDELSRQARVAADRLKMNLKAKKAGMTKAGMATEIREDRATIRRAQDFAKVVANDGWNRENVTAQYEKYRADMADYARMYDAMVAQDLSMLALAGIISEKQRAEMAANEGYATWRRDFYNEIVDPGGSRGHDKPIFVAGQRVMGNAPSSSVSSLRRRRGGMQTIVDPVYGAILNHNEILRKAVRQVVINKFADLADRLPGAFQQVELQVAYNPNTGAAYYPQEKNPNIRMAMRDGKRVPYVVSTEIQSIIDEAMTPRSMEMADRIIRAASGLFVKGTTGWFLPFMVMNYTVDQITAAAQTYNQYRPFVGHIRTLWRLFSGRLGADGEFWREYMVLTGGGQTFLRMHDMTPAEMEQAILGEKSRLDKFVEVANRIGNVLGAPIQASEILTRGQEYVLSRKAGKPQLVALEEAARVTGSFSHRGKEGGQVGRAVVSSLPYFKAAKQVLAQFRQAAADPRRRKQLAVVHAMVVAAKLLALLALAAGSDDQKEKYKDINPEELARYVFVPHPNGKDFLRFRVPEQMAALGAVINMAVVQAISGADYQPEDYLAAGTAWVPEQYNVTQGWRCLFAWIPQPLEPGIEVGMNRKTWPRVRDLVPRNMQYLPAEKQVFPNTSRVARELGKAFDVSPIKIDHLVEGYLGRTSRFFMGKPDAWRQVVNPFHRRMYFTAGVRLQHYYELAHRNKQAMNGLDDLSPGDRAIVKRNNRYIRLVTKDLKEYRAIPDPNSRRGRALRDQILDRIDMLQEW